MDNIKVKEVSSIVFVVKNNNDFEVKNIEIFNPKRQKNVNGVEIISTYDESMKLYTLQQIYDYLNEGNVMNIHWIYADCISVEVPRKISERKKKLKDLDLQVLAVGGNSYEIYRQIIMTLALEAKMKIQKKGEICYNDKLFLPPNYEMSRRFLSGLDNGWTTIFRFDKTTKIEIESIPPHTEVRYIFNQGYQERRKNG